MLGKKDEYLKSESVIWKMSLNFEMSVSMEKALSVLSREVVEACGAKYGFDAEEAIRELGLSVSMSKAVKGEKTKTKSEKAAKREIPSMPLPFTGTIREDWCRAVKQNHGLYTQCCSAPGETGLCKGCTKQASKNANGEPDCGLMARRVLQGDDYRDSKGRGPVHFTKVMKKQKLTEEQVLAEAGKFGFEIDASHFAVPSIQKRGRPKKATTSDTDSDASSTGDKKSRGRPKKAAKVVEVKNETEDLFATLMQQAQAASPRAKADDESSEVSDVSEVSVKNEKIKTAKKQKISNDQAKQEKEQAKALAKQEKELAKQAKEQAKQAKALAKQEKEQAKALEKQEKAAPKALAKQGKEKAPAAAAKQKTETKKSKSKKEEPVAAVVTEELESEGEESEDEEEEEPVVQVKKFTHEGKTYLKSSDGLLYDAKTQDVVGKWNEETKTIEECDCESESEGEDEGEESEGEDE